MTTVGYIVAAAAFVIALVIGFPIGIQYRKKVAEKEISSAEDEAKRIINEAIKSAEGKKREALLEAKEEILKNRSRVRKGSQGAQSRPAKAGAPSAAEGREHRSQDRCHREKGGGAEPEARRPPEGTGWRSSSSSAARPKCWSASPDSPPSRPRST